MFYENHVGAGVRHCKNLNVEVVEEKLHKKTNYMIVTVI